MSRDSSSFKGLVSGSLENFRDCFGSVYTLGEGFLS